MKPISREWTPVKTPPAKPGLYLIYAQSKDDRPLRHVAWWDGKKWSGLLDVKTITHWATFPPDPK